MIAAFTLTALAAVVNVTPAGAPTALDNDFTRISNAVVAANPGDTVQLSGTFNWTEANAAASWALGSDATVSTGDDYCILIPANRNNVTITAASLGAATIQGPGDLAAINLEGVLYFDGTGDNQNWTISNIRFLDFDMPIGMFFGAGGVDGFNNTIIQNNYFRIPADLNATVAPADANQNIGIHYSFGTNQQITGNTFDLPGNGVSDGVNFSTTVAMQSNTSGGNVYDGLQITNNVINVTSAQSASPSVIIGIWENAHAHLSDITISGNQFISAAGGNNPALNLQRGFRVTSHSSATTTVEYSNNTVRGANLGFQWISGSNFAGNLPINFNENNISGNDTGVLVQSQGVVNMGYNRIAGNTVAGVTNTDGIVNAENNWWGCNGGPGVGGAGCAGTANAAVGTIDFTPWLTLTSSASPGAIVTGANSTITSRLTINSNSVDTSGFGNVPDGIAASFVGTLGTVAPPSSVTASGVTGTTFTATGAGAGGVATTIDGQTVNAPVTITFSCNNLTIPAVNTLRNNVVTVPINVDSVTGRDIISFDFTVTYNPAVLTPLVPSQAGTLASGMTVTVNNNVPGTMIVSGFTSTPLSGSGVLLNLRFFADGAVGSTTPVSFTGFQFNEGTPCDNTSNGSVTIISGNVSGIVSYANSFTFKPVPNTVLNAVGSVNTSTNSAFTTGAYTLTGMGSGAYTVTPSKTTDVTSISGFDSGLIAQYVVNLISLTPAQLAAADVSEAAGVTSFDAALISRFVVSLPGSGSTGTWKFSPVNRAYPNVETNQANQDYSAILMGEVSGDWTPPTMFARPARDGKGVRGTTQDVPEGGVTVQAAVPPQNAVIGSNFDVPAIVSNLTGEGVISYQFRINFNPAVIVPQANPVDVTGTISNGRSVTVNDTVPGQLIVVVFGANPMSGAGTLFNFKFTAVGPALSNTPLTWSNFMFNEGTPTATTTNGQINLINSPTAALANVSGRVLNAAGQPVANANVMLNGTNGEAYAVRTNQFGYYLFEEVEVGNSYVIAVTSKRYTFEPRLVTVNESIVDLDIIANE